MAECGVISAGCRCYSAVVVGWRISYRHYGGTSTTAVFVPGESFMPRPNTRLTRNDLDPARLTDLHDLYDL